jgi:hypothetical protein
MLMGVLSIVPMQGTELFIAKNLPNEHFSELLSIYHEIQTLNKAVKDLPLASSYKNAPIRGKIAQIEELLVKTVKELERVSVLKKVMSERSTGNLNLNMGVGADELFNMIQEIYKTLVNLVKEFYSLEKVQIDVMSAIPTWVKVISSLVTVATFTQFALRIYQFYKDSQDEKDKAIFVKDNDRFVITYSKNKFRLKKESSLPSQLKNIQLPLPTRSESPTPESPSVNEENDSDDESGNKHSNSPT